MPTSHFLTMTLFALIVSIVFGTLLKDDLRSQARTAGLMLAGFVAAAFVLGWLMFPFPL
jgi:hypothetical protein